MQIRDRIKEFKRVPAKDLIPNPKNWRVHSEGQANALRGILSAVGYVDALLARETPAGLQIIDGHLRAETTPDMEVPVLVLDVTEAEADLILATFDPLGAMADADSEKLESLLAEIETDSEALQTMLDELAEESGIEVEEPEIVDPEPQIDRAAELQKKWGTERGQLWEITGPSGMVHRLLCGDSTDAGDVERVMGGETCDLCFTSPPYAQQRNYEKKIDDWDGLMQGVFGNIPANEKTQVLVNLGLIHREKQWVSYWNDWIEWMNSQGWLKYGWYVWDKSCGGREDGCRLPNAHEFVWHFCKQPVKPIKCEPCETAGKKTACPSKYSDKNGQYSSDDKVITRNDFRVRGSVCRLGRAAEPIEGHPAAYPSRLVMYFAEHWAGLIYDPFLGSGTTMVAAENLNRRCFGIEISAAYCGVILQRMSDLGCTAEVK